MLKNSYRLGVGLTTPWLMLFLLAFGPATRSALAVDGIVLLPQGTMYSLALNFNTGDIVACGALGSDSFTACVTPFGDFNMLFGGTGIVVTDVASNNSMTPSDASFACVVQADGKVISGGRYQYKQKGVSANGIALVRYKANGTLDTTFNKTGIVKTSLPGTVMEMRAMVLQSSGKILVAGTYWTGVDSIVLARYTSTGQLDSSFGANGNGTVITPFSNHIYPRAIVLQSDGKFVVGADLGPTGIMKLIRYTADGILDTSFGTGGIATFIVPGSSYTHLRDIAVDADDTIIAVGDSWDGTSTRFTLVRFTAGGGLDPTMGSSFAPDGTFIPGLGYVTDFGPNTNFGPGTYGYSVALQPNDRKIVISGARSGNLLVARFNPNGTLDNTFGSANGVFNGQGYAEDFPNPPTPGRSILVQPWDFKIVARGGSAIVRYNSDGTPDTSF